MAAFCFADDFRQSADIWSCRIPSHFLCAEQMGGSARWGHFLDVFDVCETTPILSQNIFQRTTFFCSSDQTFYSDCAWELDTLNEAAEVFVLLSQFVNFSYSHRILLTATKGVKNFGRFVGMQISSIKVEHIRSMRTLKESDQHRVSFAKQSYFFYVSRHFY